MKKFLIKEQNLLILFIVFLIGFFLRVYNLTLLPIFGDEAIYIRWAQVMRAEPTLRFLPLSDGKQPLFMWTVIPFLKIFSDPLIAGRIVSVFSGLGTLIGIFVLTRLFFKSFAITFIASLAYAISPFSVFFDRLALVDSMLTMFGVWVLVFSILTVQYVRLDTAMLAGFALGGAFLTKTPATFFALMIPLILILHKWPKSLKEKFNRLSVFIFLFTFTYLIGFGMYNILRLGPNFHMIAQRNKDYVFPFTHILQNPLDPFLSFFNRVLEYLWLLGPSVLFLLILIGSYFGLRLKRRETLVILTWAILPILVVLEFSKTMTARYIYFSMPYLYVLASLAFIDFKYLNLINFRGWLLGLKIGEKVLGIFLIIFVIHSFYINLQLLTKPQSANLPRSERSGYLEEWTSGYGIKEASKYIRQEFYKNPKQKIVVGTEGYFGTLPDGLQLYLNDIPEIRVVGVGLPIKEVPQSLKESKASGNKTFLIVNSTRFLGDIKMPGLKLLASYDKAFRPDGTREALLLFEVIGINDL